ncbi:MAG: putative DNA-binding domain-containing protein [Kofleriaceae bacterium]|nr:putative DNA-binding domain-containing protein [Kofleriaceae bacterium]
MADLTALLALFHDLATGRAPTSAARDLLRDDGVDPAVRAGVYAHAYVVRIRDAIAAEYPKVAAALGDATFTRMVRGYLDAFPTRRPSLRDAGEFLHRYLADGGWSDGPAWLADLAALERARTDAFDGPDADALTRADLAELPPTAFPQLRLRLVPTATLLALTHNADDAWAALEAEAPPPPAREVTRTVAVWRRDLVVIHRTLADDEAAALRAVVAGAPLGDAFEVLAGADDPAARAVELVTTWLDGALIAA